MTRPSVGGMLSRLRPQLPLWRRALRRRRHTLVVLALAAAAVLVLPALVPASVTGVDTVVAAADLPAGTVLAPEHLRTVRVAPALVPEDAARSTEELLGAETGVPIAAGQALLPSMLDAARAPTVPDGRALMAVPVPDVLTPHLAPGTRIELLTADPMTGTTARIPADVVEVITGGSDGGATSGFGTEGPARASQALVTVERGRAGEVAHALGAATVTIAVIG